MKHRGILAAVLSVAMFSTVVIAAESQTETVTPASAETEASELVQTQEELAQEEGAGAYSYGYVWMPGMAVRMPDIDNIHPWMVLRSVIDQLDQDKQTAVAQIRSAARAEKEQALSEAVQAAEAEKEQALSEAVQAAEAEKEQVLAEAAEAAAAEKEKALAEAAEAAESEKEKVLAEAAEAAESEKEKVLAEAAEAAAAEKEKVLAEAAEAAESEKEKVLEEAVKTAESEKEKALAEAAETAESEKEKALAEAAETAEAEKEKALAEAAETAEADKEQALTQALFEWESERQAQEEADLETIYNTNVWTKSETLIRESADPESKVLVVAAEGSPLTVTAQQEDAYLVDYYGLKGYVDRDSLEVPEAMLENVKSAPGLQAWCKVQLEQAATHLNVRESAGTNAKIIGQLGSEEIVYLTGNRSNDGQWAEIVYDDGGSTGWASTKYLVERTEGEPEEYTRLMYYGEYAKIADLLREEDPEEDLPAAWQNGSRTDPQTVIGNATIISEDEVYTGEVLGGKKKGLGTAVQVSADDPENYVRITSTWDGDSVSGVTTWSCGNSDPAQVVTITGTIVDDVWDKDITVRAADENGKMRYYYGYADHGKLKSYGEKDGKVAIARNADGGLFYIDPASVFAGEEFAEE